jgi:HEAT repeat protein
MGITFTTVCLKCGVSAPEVGDFGYIGLPSPAARKRRGDLQTFGFIYAGLAAIGAVTQEIEEFKAFLDEHGRHPIRQYADDEDVDEGDDSQDERPARIREFRFKRRGFSQGCYELHCAKCDGTYRSSTSERLPRFKPFALTLAKIARFRNNAAAVDEINFYHVGGFPFDDLGDIDHFLKDHRGHQITARRTREKAKLAAHEPAAANLLIAALADPSDDVRIEAVRALARWTRRPDVLARIRAMLDDESSFVVEQALETLAEAKDAAAVPRIRELLLAGGALWPGAAAALARIGGAAGTAALLDAVAHSSSEIRSEVVRRWLGQEMKAAHVADKLIPLLSDPEEQIREAAIDAFYWMGAGSAVPALSRIALNRSEPESLRSRAVGVLTHIRGSGATQTLIQCLRDESKELRLSAALGLEGCRDRKGHRALVEAIVEAGDTSLTLQFQSLLLKHGGAGTEQVLIKMLRSGGYDTEDYSALRAFAEWLAERGLTEHGTLALRREARRWLAGDPNR